MITESMTYTNDYGFGFEAVVGIAETTQRVELDINYIAAGDQNDDESLGVCMTAEAARSLGMKLIAAASRLENSNIGVTAIG